ncbi:MAG: hypothetical protein J6B89_00465 [Bacilli bacterium]|nr:hypothetical protein [Bacilli bacterium]
MNGLVTDEYSNGRKPKLKVIIFVLIFLILLVGVILLFMMFFNNSGSKKKKVQGVDISASLNPELSNTYLFAVDSDDYIVSIKKDGSVVRIYNLLQGTGVLGDFKRFSYFDKKLYLMFSNNTIYTISLTDGDKSYQLEKFFEYSPLSCGNSQGVVGADLSIYKDFVYFSNSDCSVDMYYSGGNKNVNRLNTVKTFNGCGIYLAYNKFTSSLYFYSINDSIIYRFDEKTANVSVLVENVKTDRDIDIINDVIIYTQKNSDGTYDYYGYSLKNNHSSLIVKNVLDLINYKDGFIYYNNDKVIYLSDNKEQVVYDARYDSLSNVEVIGSSKLQIVDSSIDNKRSRIINVDLSNKNKTTFVSNKYSNIQIFEDIEKSGVSN